MFRQRLSAPPTTKGSGHLQVTRKGLGASLLLIDRYPFTGELFRKLKPILSKPIPMSLPDSAVTDVFGAL